MKEPVEFSILVVQSESVTRIAHRLVVIMLLGNLNENRGVSQFGDKGKLLLVLFFKENLTKGRSVPIQNVDQN